VDVNKSTSIKTKIKIEKNGRWMVVMEYLPWGGIHSERALSLVSMLAAKRGGLPAGRGGLGSSGRDIIPANMQLV
jgi:hypothetical protein